MAYIGNDLEVAFQSYLIIDDISSGFDGSETSFTLNVNGAVPVPFPINPQQCLISVAGVIQEPDPTGSSGFNLSGNNIVFSSAPAGSSSFFGVVLAGADYVNVGVDFPAGSVAAPSITFVTDKDTGFFSKAANEIGIACAGTEVGVFSSTGLSSGFADGSATSPSIFFTSDTNTGLARAASDELIITTGGVERASFGSSEVVFNDPSNDVDFRVESNGNAHMLFVDAGNDRVGIGTTSPGHPLEVAGQIETSGSNNAVLFDGASSTPTIGAGIHKPADDTLAFVTASAERMRIDGSGRLLAGTTANTSLGADSYLAQIKTSGASAGLGIIRTADSIAPPFFSLAKSRNDGIVQSGDGLGKIQFIAHDGTDYNNISALINAEVDGTPGNNDVPGRLMFHTTADGASSPTERMRIDSAGNVGIGTSSPQRLEHLSTSTDTQLRVESTSASSNNEAAVELIRGSNQSSIKNKAGGLEFFTGGLTSERMRIDSSGRVGIGTTSPTVLLDLESSSPTIRLTDSDATGTPECQISGGGGDLVLEADRDNENSASLIRFAIDGSERMRILSTGGITFNGDTAQANALDDYEEGNWTPTSGENFGAFNSADGSYIKIGHLVTVNFIFNAASTSSTANCKISGLPYPVKNTINGSSVEYMGVCFHDIRMYGIFAQGGTSNIVVETDRPIEGSTTTGAVFLRGSVTYETT